jgi:hypothetical protein
MAGRKRKRKLEREPCRALAVVSDLHCGCRLGLCPPEGAALADGGPYMPSPLQRRVWAWWEEFWGEFVPRATRGQPFAALVNGETIDGVHHRATTQISQNLDDQRELAKAVLRPVVELCEGRFYVVNGTPAHSGEQGCDDEAVARDLGAIPDDSGRYARYAAWLRVGDALVHAAHHIGTTGSQHYESTAVHKELIEAYGECGRWNDEPPDFIVRSHRHRYITTSVATSKGFAASIVTPGWQLKTPFAFKIPGARMSEPQFGGVVFLQGDEEAYFRQWVRRLERPKEVRL